MADLVLWRRLDLPGHELGGLERAGDGWRLFGTSVFAHEKRPCALRYSIACDAGWRTLAAEVTGRLGRRAVEIAIAADRQRRWRVNGKECPEVEGCLDLDLAFSPSTNLLPIRRLDLAVGREAAVTAAWLAFPDLVLQPLPQKYRREDETAYRYEAGDGSFVRKLKVGPAGLVVNYPGLYEAEIVFAPDAAGA